VTSGTIQIFPYDVLPGQLMYMKYFLLFRDANQNPVHLEGQKNIIGENCMEDLEPMLTTLYWWIRTGEVIGAGTIIDTGIVELDVEQVTDFVLSFYLIGNGNIDQDLNTWVAFMQFLYDDVTELCLNVTDFENDFWYVWTVDPSTGIGFLLDMIKRTEELELRLALYNNSGSQTVIRQYLPLSSFKQPGENTIIIGPLALDVNLETLQGSLIGTDNMVPINVLFTLNGNYNTFLPEGIMQNDILPNVTSFYGTLNPQTKVNNYAYPANIPAVYTKYPIKLLINYTDWSMISSSSFQNSDLQIELMALEVPILDLWPCIAYIYYNNETYHLNNPFLFECSMDQIGDESNGIRTFSASLFSIGLIHMDITCSSPSSNFVLLDQQGESQIHTTVLGTCVVDDIHNGVTLKTKGQNALLELKK